MIVEELIAQLQELDPSLPVIVSKDSLGNSYRPICEVDTAHTEDPTERYIENIYYNDEDYAAYYEEPFEDQDYVLVAVIW